MTFTYKLHEQTKVILVLHDHLSHYTLNISPEPSNPTHNIVTFLSEFQAVKHALQSRFLRRAVPYFSIGKLPLTINGYKSTIKSHWSETVSKSASIPAPNPVFQIFSLQIEAEEVDLSHPNATPVS